MSKLFIIVNPIAGRGAAKKAVPAIKTFLDESGMDYDLVFTDYKGHGIELARESGANGYDTVVAVGGDGTANEIINGLMQASESDQLRANLAVLPVGRGNDFSYGMGIPQDLKAACAALAAGRTRKIDIGLVKGGNFPDGRFFGNGVGIGFDTIVGFEAAKLPPFINGVPAYLLAALKTIFLYFDAPILHLDIDGEILEQPCLLVSLMNGRRMGGSFMMAPDSRSDDGLMNLCIAHQVSRLKVLGLFPKVMGGTQHDHPAIKMPKAKKVKVTAVSGSLPVHADGETICEAGESLEIELLPLQINLVCE